MALALDAVLAELLGRLRAQRSQAVDVSAADLRGWPRDVVDALLAGGVLLKGKPAESIVCDGCEEACVRPVHVVARTGGEAAAFVLCHLRDDIDRVPVALDDLERWRLTVQSLADALAALLPAGKASMHGGVDGGYRLGFVSGRKQDRAVLNLRNGDPGLRLVVAGHLLALEDVLVLSEGRLALDMRMLARCVDAPADAAAADPPESLEVVGKRMLERKLALKAARKRAFLKVIAQEEGCSESWVKQLIVKAEAAARNPFAGLGTAAPPNTTVSTPRKHRR
jgi:hypothetical protein